MRCNICKTLMTEGGMREDCGGDCLRCMVAAGDTDALRRAYRVQQGLIQEAVAALEQVPGYGSTMSEYDLIRRLQE